VVIKILFVLLVLCTAALLAVGVALLLRVRRHLTQEHMDSQVRSAVEEIAEQAAEEEKSP
jgi:hypothetical protein